MSKEVFAQVLDYRTALTGCVVHSGITMRKGAFQGFRCQDYTVVSTIKNADGVDVTSTMGLRGVTLSPGSYIGMAKGDYIYSISLTSGSIVLYSLGAIPSRELGVSDIVNAFISRATVDGATIESTSCVTTAITNLS